MYRLSQSSSEKLSYIRDQFVFNRETGVYENEMMIAEEDQKGFMEDAISVLLSIVSEQEMNLRDAETVILKERAKQEELEEVNSKIRKNMFDLQVSLKNAVEMNQYLSEEFTTAEEKMKLMKTGIEKLNSRQNSLDGIVEQSMNMKKMLQIVMQTFDVFSRAYEFYCDEGVKIRSDDQLFSSLGYMESQSDRIWQMFEKYSEQFANLDEHDRLTEMDLCRDGAVQDAEYSYVE